NTSGILRRQDGVISGTDPTKDYTLGVGVGYGATVTPLTSSNLTGTAIRNNLTVAAPGVGYTSTLNMGFWCGAAGAGQPGALQPGSGALGFGNVSGGGVTSLGLSPGGSRY